MRKTLSIIVTAFIVLSLVYGLGWAEEEQMCVPMGEVVLKPLAPEPEREAVTFPHAVHFSNSCHECHHKWDNETSIQSCSAAGCHDLAEPLKDEEGQPVKDELQQIRYYKNAFHNMCIGCHKQIKQKNKALQDSQLPGSVKLAAVGPTGCIGCHPKE